MIHAFDAARVSSELAHVKALETGALHELGEKVVARSSGNETVATFDALMGSLEKTFGKKYSPFEYHGSPEATAVFVSMGTAASKWDLSGFVWHGK